jgi:nucleoside-diphosphate-sugar epimerase
MTSPPKTVAITGATGFIGGHIVAQLGKLGWRVRLLTRRLPVGPIPAGGPFSAVIGSLSDDDAVDRLIRGSDAVVHCAGLIKAATPADFFVVNAAATGRIARVAAGQPRPPRFVLLSSLAAREPGLSPYAASKRAGEDALAEAAGGMAWLALRPPVVYGPGDRETLLLFRAMLGGLVVLPPPANRLSMIHAEDVAGAVATALESRQTALACEIDDGRPGGYDWREVVAIAAQATGRRSRALTLPRAVFEIAALGSEWAARLRGRPAIFGRGKVREMFHPDWVCRPSTLAAAEPWRPRIGLAEGIATTLAWYRAQGWL